MWFIVWSLATVFFIWNHKYKRKKEAEGEIMYPPSVNDWFSIGLCACAAIWNFLEMTGLMEPLKAWLQSVE